MKKIILAALMILTLMALTACTGNQGTRTDTAVMDHSDVQLKAFKLTIPAADCASTAGVAGTMLDDIDGVSDSYVDMDTGTAEIKIDFSKTSIDTIKKIMEAGDYTVTAVQEMK